MKDIDASRLIQLFENTASGNEFKESLPDLRSHGYVILGMVIRGVENYYILCDMLTRKHGEDFIKVKNDVESQYFYRLFLFLDKFDIENPSMVDQALEHDSSSIEYALDALLSVFETREEYEKCHRILLLKQTLLNLQDN